MYVFLLLQFNGSDDGRRHDNDEKPRLLNCRTTDVGGSAES